LCDRLGGYAGGCLVLHLITLREDTGTIFFLKQRVLSFLPGSD
jgi:hypothetical protein